MRKQTFLVAAAGAVVVTLVMVLIGATVSLGSPDTALKWSVFGSSGSKSASSTNYKLGFTSGQSSPIGASQSTNYKLGAGFSYGVALGAPGDTDGDGCPDVNEQQTAAGSEFSGGRRDYLNPWDWFDANHDGQVLIDDVVAVVDQYFIDAGNPNYTTATDRSGPNGPNAWDLGAPDGVERIDDVVDEVNQYFHKCP